MFDTDDTIVAVSSAAGAAGRSIVRLSGPEAVHLAEGVFSEPLARLGGFRSVGGTVSVDGPYPIAVPARVYVFRGPRSYTRQDVVELHVPGEVGAAVVCSAVIDAGARQAGPGEFTARAFLSGRLDLASAEAVADVIDAQADAQLRSAVGVLDGALARLCRPAAETLTEALAVIEAAIDFADEGLELTGSAELAATIGKVADDLSGALSAAGRWRTGGGEVCVAIAGRPNAGKSSLLNALSGVERAIVSAMAGTTRDVLSAPARLPGGAQIMLLDAAGLEVFADRADPLTRAAHSAAREAIRSAEAILFVIDVTDDLAYRSLTLPSALRLRLEERLRPEGQAGDPNANERLFFEVVELNRRAPLLILANKTDLVADRRSIEGWHGQVKDLAVAGDDTAKLHSVPLDRATPARQSRIDRAPVADPDKCLVALRRRFDRDVLPISALTGAGLDDLRRVLAERLDLLAAPQPGGLLLHDRQRRSIAAAVEAAGRAAEMLNRADEVSDIAELAAVELRSSLAGLAEITGQVVTEDILSTIFARFCVGK